MIKKYVPFIIILLLIGYAVFDFILKENSLNASIENATETERASGKEALDKSSDVPPEKDFIESSQTSAEAEFAPDFQLSDMKGASVKLSDLKGKIVFLNFWATWCPPCREEMPHMQNFYEKNEKSEVEIVAVNLTNLDSGPEAIAEFVQDYGLTFPVLLDDQGNVGMMYEIRTIPTSYILDTEGRIFQKIIGPMDEEIMNDMVQAIRMYDEGHGD